jgi:hypothetical protein
VQNIDVLGVVLRLSLGVAFADGWRKPPEPDVPTSLT